MKSIFLLIGSFFIFIFSGGNMKKNHNVICEDNKIKYTIVFETNGGENISSLEVKENSLASKPLDPKKDGYIFKGWYKSENFNNDTKWNFNEDTVTTNVLLYAEYEKIGE